MRSVWDSGGLPVPGQIPESQRGHEISGWIRDDSLGGASKARAHDFALPQGSLQWFDPFTVMKHVIALLLLLVSCSWAVAADVSSLNGVWVVAEAEFDGSSVSSGDLPPIELKVQDGKYTFDMGDTHAKGTVTVDFSKTPAAMTSTETEGPNAGKTIQAVAELTPDGWRACYPMAEGAAAKALKTESGSGLLLVRYARKPGTTAGPKPLKVLLILGGCCHDYAAQKDILKKGLEARANVQVNSIYSPDTSTHPPLPIFGKPDYANGYDVVLHDECAADISDPEVVRGVLAPHRQGIPGVNLHCAMHSYRTGNPGQPAVPGTPHALWFEYLGLQSSGHGPQKPIELTFLDAASPVTRGMTNWTTINEELYNNVKVGETAHALVRGRQGAGDKPGQNDTVVGWTNEYGPVKTRVFSTTIGHNNETVADPRYLDLVARGLLWACGKLTPDGQPAAGYGAGGR